MANQINIDIGAAANDGTGDPLRTAFNYVNLNFANVWTTGLPNSNVQFNNNCILTVNTNANLILAPNGTGIVQSNVSILPNTDRVHNLGSSDKKWNNLYVQYLNISDLTVSSDLTVDGNLTVQGDTIQIGNIVTDTKTIQLANTAANSAAANGSGITVGTNDNIATLLYNSSSNVWTTNIGISAVGNIVAPYFIGNGSLLTGLSSYSNANVDAYLPVYSGNISAAYINVANNINVINDVYAKRGTFTGDPVTGDASLYVGSPTFTNLGTDVMAQFTGNVTNYAQINLQNYGNSNTASTDYIITADNGSDTTHFLDLGLTGSNWDGTQPNSLGNRLGPNDGYLYVQDGDFVLGTSNGTIETWKFDQTGNLTLPDGGNINEFSGQTARFQAINEDGQSQAALLVNSNYGLVRLESFDNQSSGSFSTADWATGEYINNGGSGEIVFTDATTIINFFSTVDNSRVFYQVNGGNLLPSAGWGSGGNNITFYTAIPPAISPETVTNFTIYYSNRSMIDMDYDEGELNILSRGLDINITSDQSIDVTTNDIIRLQNYGNSSGVGIITDAGNAFHIWNFQASGNLTLPSQGSIVGATPNNAGHLQWEGNSSGDGNGYTTMKLVPDDTRESSDQYLIIDPTAPGHIHIRAGGTQDNSSADLFLGGENSYFRVNAGANAEVQVTSNSNTWVFNTDGNLQIPGNINGDNNAPLVIDGASAGVGYISLPHSTFGGEQIVIVNKFGLGNGIRLETNGGNLFFSDSADLSVTGNITGNTAGFAIGYRDIPQISFTGNVTISAADAGKHFYSTESTDYTLTIDNNSNVAWPLGTAITVVNRGTGNITIVEGTGVDLYLAGNSTAGNRTISTYGMASLLNVAANVWMINGTGVA